MTPNKILEICHRAGRLRRQGDSLQMAAQETHSHFLSQYEANVQAADLNSCPFPKASQRGSCQNFHAQAKRFSVPFTSPVTPNYSYSAEESSEPITG